MFSYTAILVGQ